MTFEEMRRLLSERLRLRAAFWREKALETDCFPEKCLTRAEEADSCAEIAESLGENYVSPAKPDMVAAANASRRPK